MNEFNSEIDDNDLDSAQDICNDFVDGFDSVNQTLSIGATTISLRVPNCGDCKLSVIPNHETSAKGLCLHFTWEGSDMYFDMEIKADGSGAGQRIQYDNFVVGGLFTWNTPSEARSTILEAISSFVSSPRNLKRVPIMPEA